VRRGSQAPLDVLLQEYRSLLSPPKAEKLLELQGKQMHINGEAKWIVYCLAGLGEWLRKA